MYKIVFNYRGGLDANEINLVIFNSYTFLLNNKQQSECDYI